MTTPAAPLPDSLADWLAHCERQHPKGQHGIILGLDRVRAVAQRLNGGAGLRWYAVTGRVRESSHGEPDNLQYRTELIADTFSILAKSDKQDQDQQ